MSDWPAISRDEPLGLASGGRQYMKVLYVNHTGALGGAEHSLLTLLEGLPSDVRAIVASPPGRLRERVLALGLCAELLPGTSGSFRLHLVHTPRAVLDIARSAAAVQAICRRHGIDLVHANSVRAGLITVPRRVFGRAPVVVHVRDVMPPGLAGTLTASAVHVGARRIVCISEHVAAGFGGRNRLQVIHNGVNTRRFDPATLDRAAMRSALGLQDDDRALGVAAQLTPWKGQDDAIAALAQVRSRHPRVRLLLVGEAKFLSPGARFDNSAYRAALVDQARRLGVLDAVTFLGERDDMPAVLHALDILLVPSWDEPFGRSVIEGMAMGRAVLATCVGGPSEIIEHDVTGLLAPPRDPAAWARQIIRLLDDQALRNRLGDAGRARVSHRFDAERHVQRIVETYRTLVDTSRSARTAGTD